MDLEALLTIGALSERTGVAPSALRFYEAEGLIHANRASSGQRRYTRGTLRRVSFIRVAQQVGLSLQEIREAMASLPDNRTPTERDWHRLSASWRPRLDDQIAMLERLRDRLDTCIGCGCLSLKACRLLNPYDEAAADGPGPRYLLAEGPDRSAVTTAAVTATATATALAEDPGDADDPCGGDAATSC